MPASSMRQHPSHSTYHRHILSGRPHPLQKIDHLAVIMPFRRGQEICSQGEPADHWYFVMSGAARRGVFRPDGRRQIVDLLFPGDFFGLTAGEEYNSGVEAIAKETVLAAYPRRRVEMAADWIPTSQNKSVRSPLKGSPACRRNSSFLAGSPRPRKSVHSYWRWQCVCPVGKTTA